MPSQLPSLSATKVIKTLSSCGFVRIRQKGSHVVLFNEFTKARVVIPMHKGHDIKKPLLKKIIEQEAGITIKEFLKLV